MSAVQPPAAWLAQVILTGAKRGSRCPSRQAVLNCIAGDAPPPTDRLIAGHLSDCSLCRRFVRAVFWNCLLFHHLCDQEGWLTSSGSRRTLRFWQTPEQWIDVALSPLGVKGGNGVSGLKLTFPDIGSLFITATGEQREQMYVWMNPYPPNTKVVVGVGTGVFMWHELHSGQATSLVGVDLTHAVSIALQIKEGATEKTFFSGRPVPILVAAASIVEEHVESLLVAEMPQVRG